MKKLWCDLRSDAERSDYILSGQAYDAGIIAHAIQADVAMAFHRCSEYDAEVRRLREENGRLRKDADRLEWLLSDFGKHCFSVDHAWDGESDLRVVIDKVRGANKPTRICEACATYPCKCE